MKLDSKIQNEIKDKLGEKAANYVEDGMLVGLGTGTTATFFIDYLIKRCQSGLNITAVASSFRSMEQARKGGIRVLDMNEVTSIDLTVDGADEIDPKWQMIKGGGGAHVREKILASTSKKLIIIVDESKLVKTLGKFGLPVEINPFGCTATVSKISNFGYKGQFRKDGNKTLITENGNYLFDISPMQFKSPRETHEKLRNIPGVIDTGFFFSLATKVLVGYSDGKVADWVGEK